MGISDKERPVLSDSDSGQYRDSDACYWTEPESEESSHSYTESPSCP